MKAITPQREGASVSVPAAISRPRLARPGNGALRVPGYRTPATLRDADVYQKLSTEYDVVALEQYFRGKPLLVATRYAQVAKRVAGFWVSQTLRRNMGRVKGSGSSVEQQEADALCAGLAALGPTFVKLGQTLSTREDLIGRKYSRALQNLQVSAPPFDDALAMQVLTTELGKDPREAFQDISPTSVAAASLGQVYQAHLPASGALAAVKVQRPDLLGSIALDVYLLRSALGLVRRVSGINSDIRSLADEVGRGLFAELDYRVEARQTRLFADAHKHLPFIHAAQVVEGLTSSRVITTQWIDGDSPTDLLSDCENLPRASPQEAASRAKLVSMVNMGVECSLSQLLETGIMHADPHPGNLIMMRDGRLAYLDFGMLSFVPPESSQAMMACLVHVALGEWRSMADDLGRMGMLKDRTDRDALAVSLAEEVLAVWPLAGSFSSSSFLPDGSAREGGALAQRISDGTVDPVLGLGQGLSFGKLAKAIIKLAIKYRFKLPAYYTLIVRSLCTLEGIALRVDPSFSIVNASIPIILRRLLTDPRPAAVSLLRELLLEGGTKLRIGMLEGLLRNYSIEAGKGMATDPASNVVLKGREPKSAPAGSSGGGGGGAARSAPTAASDSAQPYGVSNASAAIAMAPPVTSERLPTGEVPGATGLPGASPSGATGVGGAAADASRAGFGAGAGVGEAGRASAEASGTGPGAGGAGVVEVVEGVVVRDAMTAELRGGALNSLDVAVATASAPLPGTEHEAAPGRAGAPGPSPSAAAAVAAAAVAASDRAASASASASAAAAAEAAAQPEPEAVASTSAPSPESLQAQVVAMVLSARAAGVRRVLLEADMQDVVQEVSGPEGDALQEKAATALAAILTSGFIWRALRIACGIALSMGASRAGRLIGRRGKRKAPRGMGLSFGALELGPVPVKRAQLMAAVGLQRLWEQSKMTTIASMFLGLKIVMRAMRIRKSSRRAAA